MVGSGRRTMTGYLLLTKGEASLARRGPLAMTRAGQLNRQYVFSRGSRSSRKLSAELLTGRACGGKGSGLRSGELERRNRVSMGNSRVNEKQDEMETIRIRAAASDNGSKPYCAQESWCGQVAEVRMREVGEANAPQQAWRPVSSVKKPLCVRMSMARLQKLPMDVDVDGRGEMCRQTMGVARVSGTRRQFVMGELWSISGERKPAAWPGLLCALPAVLGPAGTLGQSGRANGKQWELCSARAADHSRQSQGEVVMLPIKCPALVN